jgi:uracil-DNA glycosylase
MHPSARLLIAGQAPGRRAHERGVPFDDPSGVRLRDWLGIDRATFYDASQIAILPMGFCFPGTGKGGDLPPRAECAPAWRERLLASLPHLELTLVIGRYAHQWHLGDRQSATVTETVANWRMFWPGSLPLPHPSPRNVRWLRQNAWFEKDVLPVLARRVERILSSGLGHH